MVGEKFSLVNLLCWTYKKRKEVACCAFSCLLLAVGAPFLVSKFKGDHKKVHASAPLNIQSSYYSRFSEAAIASSKGALPEALDASRKLWKEMEADLRFMQSEDVFGSRGQILYVLNLIRIASLEQRLGRQGTELEAWAALERYVDEHTEARILLHQQLKEGHLSFYDYLRARKAVLAS